MIKKLVPDQYSQFSDQNIEEPVIEDDLKKAMRENNYNFIRVVNGILFTGNNMNISIDRETGDVRSFYFNWSDNEFPQKAGLITKEVAASQYFKGNEAKLFYFQKSTYDSKTGAQIMDPIPKLVYSFSRKDYTNAGRSFC